MNYQRVITRRALAEVEATFRWYAEYSSGAANRWRNRLLKAIDELETNPQRFPLAPEADFYLGELRQNVFGKRAGRYRILFEIDGDTVWIMRVRRGSQDLLGPHDFSRT